MNIEEHRQPWESDEHWVFRQEFMIAHQGKFSDDRLLCLAQVFANIELLGCTYPGPVMREVNQLATAITNLDDLRKKRLEKSTVKFVKASDGQGNDSDPKRQKNASSCYLGFVKSSSDLNDPASTKNMRTQEKSVVTSSNTNPTPKHVENTYISQLDGSVRDMPNQTFDWMSTKKNKFEVNQNVTKQLPIQKQFNILTHMIQDKCRESKNLNAMTLLLDACSRSFVKLTWDETMNMNARDLHEKCCAVIKINEIAIASAKANTKKKAKFLGFKAAFEVLRNPNFQIIENNNGSFRVSTGMEKESEIQMEEDPEVKDEMPDSKRYVPVSVSRALSVLASILVERFTEMAKFLKKEEFNFPNVFELAHAAAKKASVTVLCSFNLLPDLLTSSGYPCFIARVFLDGVLAGIASGDSKKLSKASAYNDFAAKFKQPSLKILCNPNGILQLATPKISPSDQVPKEYSVLASVLQAHIIEQTKLLEWQEFKQCNVLDLIQRTASRAKVTVSCSFDVLPGLGGTNPSKPCLMSRLFLSGVLVGIGTGENKVLSKENAYRDGIANLKQSAVKLAPSPDGVLQLGASNISAIPVEVQSRHSTVEEDSEDEMSAASQDNSSDQELLLISDLGLRISSTYLTIIRQSADFNRVPSQFEITHENQGGLPVTKCQVFVAGKLYGEACAESMRTAKNEAARIAWLNMQKLFYTVQMKCIVAEEDGQVSVESLFTNEKPSGALTENNIGFQMLRMMGWQEGGGVGKGGSGITHPISVNDVYKREGIGFGSRTRNVNNFRTGVETLIKNYAESGNSSDLSFAAEFSKPERKLIHRIAEKYNLRNSCVGGKGPNRRVILSRRFRPRELLQHLMRSGGSTNKYELISPTG